MANISVSLPSDGETVDVADYNTPINTIVNEINGGLDNSNITAAAAIAGSKLADTSVTVSKIDYSTIPIPYGGGTFINGTTKTFTPTQSGILYVVAQARRNSGSGGDLAINLSATGVTGAISGGGVGNGTVDGHTSATYMAIVAANVSVTITISATGGSVANPGYNFMVIPGAPTAV